MEWGMKNRLAQLIKSDGRCLFLPIDHGYFQGPTRKLEKPGETIRPLLRYCDALFVTRGVAALLSTRKIRSRSSSGFQEEPASSAKTFLTKVLPPPLKRRFG